MNPQDQARALMMRHHHNVKNRACSMLNRAAAEIGLEVDDYQGKALPSFKVSYDRSNASMS